MIMSAHVAAPRPEVCTGVSDWVLGLDELVATLRKRARVPKRDIEGPFFFAIDHCFPIRGQGTVVTGTALRGQCKVGDSVELPALGMELCGNQISAAPRHRRDVASVAASARWREGSTPSTRRCPRDRVGIT